MAEKTKSKKKKKFKVKKSSFVYIGLGVVGLFLVGSLIVGSNAAPGNPFYKVDSKFEEIQAKTKLDNYTKIDHELSLAYERLDEVKEVESDADAVDGLLDSFSGNLDNIVVLLEEITQEEGYDQDKFADEILDLMQIQEEQMRRDIVMRRESAESHGYDDSQRRINRAGYKLNIFSDEVFGIGAKNIDENEEFNYFALKRMGYMFLELSELVNLSREDYGKIVEYLNDEQKDELTNMINQAQEDIDYVKSNIGVEDNKIVYEKIENVYGILDGEYTDRLVEITGGR